MIRGSACSIRHINRSDLPALAPLLSDLDLRGEYLPSALVSPLELEKKFAADGVADEAFTRLLIVEQGTDRIIGTIWHFTEAVRLLARHLFESMLINRLEIRMDARNLASEKVAIKSGFKKEGVARGANFVRGHHVDMNLYALLRNELDD